MSIPTRPTLASSGDDLSPPDDDPDNGLPLAVFFPGADSILVIGRSRKCLLDSIPLDASSSHVYSLHHASDLLEKAGWTRLGDWRLTAPPTPEIRRLGIPPHAAAVPVTRMTWPR